MSNLALRDFHVRVYVDRATPNSTIGDAYPTVYSLAWLQLVNDLINDAPVQDMRQRDVVSQFVLFGNAARALYDQHRTEESCTAHRPVLGRRHRRR